MEGRDAAAGRERRGTRVEVRLCELGVEQGHFRCRMAQQIHESRKADARPKHLGCEGMAEHVGDDGSGNAESGP